MFGDYTTPYKKEWELRYDIQVAENRDMLNISLFREKLGTARKACRQSQTEHVQEKEMVHYIREFKPEKQIVVYSF